MYIRAETPLPTALSDSLHAGKRMNGFGGTSLAHVDQSTGQLEGLPELSDVRGPRLLLVPALPAGPPSPRAHVQAWGEARSPLAPPSTLLPPGSSDKQHTAHSQQPPLLAHTPSLASTWPSPCGCVCAVQAGVPVVEKIRWLDQELSHLQCPYPIEHIEFTFAGDAGQQLPASAEAQACFSRAQHAATAVLSRAPPPSLAGVSVGLLTCGHTPCYPWPCLGGAVVQFISDKAMERTLSRYAVLKWRAMEIPYRPCTEDDIRALWWVGIAGCPRSWQRPCAR